ncbi:MAG TPA: hypothetical protein PLM33_06080 [Acidobacteriota bacterium]|nr:hypothetical protein [Acidobacteriota bacterium]HRR25932.1 hypothetical protein [Acidobacteriota bacterium]HRV08002.1 hypothetical protein [Acidobacteriota bacterium]
MSRSFRWRPWVYGFLVILALSAGIWQLLSYWEARHADLQQELETLRLDLRRESVERHRTEEQVRRIQDLYGWIDSQLTEQGEGLSQVLRQSLQRRDTALQEIRNLLTEMDAHLQELAQRVSAMDAARMDFETQVAAALDALGRNVETQHQALVELESSVDRLVGQLAGQTDQTTRGLANLRKEWDTQLKQVSSELEKIARASAANQSWAQAEVQRIDRRMDDLNHRLRQLETQRNSQ